MIIAHRGASFEAPENTLAAINLAWHQGVEAVEIDIQLSKDKQIIVIHDADTNRLAGFNKKVKDQTYGELRKLDVGLWKNEQWKGEKIPSLQEVLDTVAHGKKIIIEIKSEADILPFLRESISNSGLKTEQVVFIGFDLKTMAMTRIVFPHHKVLWLLDLDYYWIGRTFNPSITKAIAKAKAHMLDGLNVWAGKMLGPALINQVKASGLLIYCWTVNDEQTAKNLMDWGIDAITTDRAQWLKFQIQLADNP